MAADHQAEIIRLPRRTKIFLENFLTKYLLFRIIAIVTETFGGVAQLGERLTGSQEVMGSIPTVSTKERPEIARFQVFFVFCGQFIPKGRMRKCTDRKDFG